MRQTAPTKLMQTEKKKTRDGERETKDERQEREIDGRPKKGLDTRDVIEWVAEIVSTRRRKS